MKKTQNRRKITCNFVSVNTRGLSVRKIGKIKEYFDKNHVDVAFLQEIKHLNIQRKFSAIFGSSYVLIPNEVNKLGCMVIVKKASRFRVEVTDFNGPGFIGQSISILQGSETLKCLNIYAPPSQNFDMVDADLIVGAQFDVVAGDVNAHVGSWSCKNLNRVVEKCWEFVMRKLELISIFGPDVQTWRNCYEEWSGSTDCILVKPKIDFEAWAGSTMNVIADHRSLFFKIHDFTLTGVGEDKPAKAEYGVNYSLLDAVDVKKVWEDEIKNWNNGVKYDANLGNFIETGKKVIQKVYVKKKSKQ